MTDSAKNSITKSKLESSKSTIIQPPLITQKFKGKLIRNGRIVPHPHEYASADINLGLMLSMFVGMYFLLIFPAVAVHQELLNPGGFLNNLVRKHLYGQGNLHDYFALDVLNQPVDLEVPLCDYRTLTPKQFFNEYVRKGRPCLFKEYGKN